MTEVNRIVYDRSFANRKAIVNHDNIQVKNGLSEEKEQEVKGLQLDLDVYHDKYGDLNDDEYMKAAVYEIKTDLEKYYENMSDDEFKAQCQKIAENNDIELTVDENDPAYIDKFYTELARMSHDGDSSNDYVDLNDKVVTEETPVESQAQADKVLAEVQEQIVIYDRSDAEREANANHDDIDVVEHGLGDEKEEEVSGNQFDIDKYYDTYHKDYDKNDEESYKEYKEKVKADMKEDLEACIKKDDPNMTEDKVLAKLKILARKNGMNPTGETTADDIYDAFAERTWDGTLDNDYIDLN